MPVANALTTEPASLPPHLDEEIDRLPDRDLVEWAATAVAVPRVGPADSFVLHAPLELMARAALLPRVEPVARPGARRRLAAVATQFDASGPAAPVGAVVPRSDITAGAARLSAAIEAGDLDGAATAAAEMAVSTTAEGLTEALAADVVARLAAAAHGTIYLYQLPRLAPSSPSAAAMAAGLARELARHPDRRIEWVDARSGPGPSPDARPGGDPRALAEVLAGPPSPGDPGSTFIHPTMSLVDRSGLAADLLDGPTRGLDAAEARRVLLRTAAHSMLQDDPAHAPYGWSHCLTLPQAILGLASRPGCQAQAVAIAATHVLGFRATLGTVELDQAWVPVDPGPDARTSFLEDGPAAAAAAVWHAPAEIRRTMARQVATAAALHHDAHLAKYTVACFDAARDDPGAGPLFLAAAAFLASWWLTSEA